MKTTNYKKIVNKNKTNSNHAVVVNRVVKSPLEIQLQSVREEKAIQKSYNFSHCNTANPEQSNATLL